MKFSKEEVLKRKAIDTCKKQAIKNISVCYHPKCSKPSINSHILQKNGILSSIAPDAHLWRLGENSFTPNLFPFERKGINRMFSFKCFCKEHDSALFKKIENNAIDFSDYKSLVLFTIRVLYNELFRMQVNANQLECLMKTKPEIYDNDRYKNDLEDEKQGIGDLRNLEKTIWGDLLNESRSFIFYTRELPLAEVCLSSFFTYDTTEEMEEYIERHGQPMEILSEIFINLFPYKGRSVLTMGFLVVDKEKVNEYVSQFFKKDINEVYRLITNLMLFTCENWVCSDKFHEERIKGYEEYYVNAAHFSGENKNERKIFNLNVFADDFEERFLKWKKEYIN